MCELSMFSRHADRNFFFLRYQIVKVVTEASFINKYVIIKGKLLLNPHPIADLFLLYENFTICVFGHSLLLVDLEIVIFCNFYFFS